MVCYLATTSLGVVKLQINKIVKIFYLLTPIEIIKKLESLQSWTYQAYHVGKACLEDKMFADFIFRNKIIFSETRTYYWLNYLN